MDLDVAKSTVCLPKIKNVLLKYATSAANSLHGPKSSDHYSMMKHEYGSVRGSGSHHHVHHKKRDVSSISQDHRSSSSSSCNSSNPGKLIENNNCHLAASRPSVVEHQKLGESQLVAGVPSSGSMNSLVNFTNINQYYYEAMKSLGAHPMYPFLPSPVVAAASSASSIPGESSNPYNGYNKYSEVMKSFTSSGGSRLFPILTPPDQTVNEYTTTLLHDCVIPCFVIGGEKRLCMPKILVSVLKDFSLGDINAVLDELQIYCSRCTPEQLALLKKLEVIPNSTPSCGLITKTDAERLVSALLDKQQPRVNFSNISSLTSSTIPSSSPSSSSCSSSTAIGGGTNDHVKERGENTLISTSSNNNNNNINLIAKNTTDKSDCVSGKLGSGIAIRIHHNCFGKCTGIFRPSMYTSMNSPCIECTTCSGLFSPSKFVCHTHKARNSRTCHWGFDSNNWRSYLVLSDHVDDAQSQDILENMKSKFQPLQVEQSSPFFLPAFLSSTSSNKSPALLGLPNQQMQQQHPLLPQPKTSSLELEHLDQHHKDSLLPHPKRFKSCSSSSAVTLTSGLRSLLDMNGIDKTIQSKILEEVDLIIERVKSQI